MDITVFYSWQSDLPNSTNRGFIEAALDQAAKSIHIDETIKIEPVVDRDTAGIPGSPDIASTIFAKIEQADVFVCDVSIINHTFEKRKTPNPNVLIELGYAMKTMGTTRIIMVLNDAYGGMEFLPFDLRLRRVLSYHMPESEKDRATERKKLQSKLENALRIMFKTEEYFLQEASQTSIPEQARSDIENAVPGQIISTRKFMKWLVNEVNTLAPDFSSEEERDELLLASLAKTETVVYEFARVAEVVSAMNSEEVADEIFKNFAPLLESYNLPKGYSGSYNRTDFDYYKFLGHELIVCLISPLLRDGRWSTIANLLEKGIYVENRKGSRSGIVYFDYFSEYLQILTYRNDRLKLNRVSVHADLINERHTKGIVAEIVPMEHFIEADFFLFLRAGLSWRPWSTIYLGYRIPRFLIEAASQRYAQNLISTLKVESLDAFKEHIVERMSQLRKLYRGAFGFHPLEDFELKTLGSQG